MPVGGIALLGAERTEGWIGLRAEGNLALKVTDARASVAVPVAGVPPLVAGLGEPELAYDEVVTLFTLGELDDLANVAGLVRRDEAGGYDGRPLVPGASERWILVYEKPESRAKAERSSG